MLLWKLNDKQNPKNLVAFRDFFIWLQVYKCDTSYDVDFLHLSDGQLKIYSLSVKNKHCVGD